MNVRAQLVMVFNLDKCIGCHTCSIACKNIWTARKGVEYMWWNNVETRPGVGYPQRWEDQERYRGGWVRQGDKVRLAAMGKAGTLMNIFFQPNLPRLEDYYEPFDFDFGNLYRAAPGDDQPVAGAYSQVSGAPMDQIKMGPNWDDDLSGSNVYAATDPNLTDRRILDDFGRIFMIYLPRICNHCLNPGCLAACPSKAIYKRGEDGVVLVDQNVCKGWRFCVTGCPYKKTYFNWKSGKAEKCIFCYPRTETGQCNACAHSCVGRIRSLGVLLYDAEGVEDALLVPDEQLVERQRALILDPNDTVVQEAARKNGVSDEWIWGAVKSPAYALVKRYGVALPLHPEFRTVPMTWYIPPLSPLIASVKETYGIEAAGEAPSLDQMRVPIEYLSRLLSGGNTAVLREVLAKLVAVRGYMREKNLGNTPDEKVLRDAGLGTDDAQALYRLMTIAGYNERNVIPRQQREDENAHRRKGEQGVGILRRPKGGL